LRKGVFPPISNVTKRGTFTSGSFMIVNKYSHAALEEENLQFIAIAERSEGQRGIICHPRDEGVLQKL
jgi:predicted transcriptional regulator